MQIEPISEEVYFLGIESKFRKCLSTLKILFTSQTSLEDIENCASRSDYVVMNLPVRHVLICNDEGINSVIKKECREFHILWSHIYIIVWIVIR